MRKIADGGVNDSWIRALQEVEEKIKAVDSRDPTQAKAVQDVKPELERLTNKVPGGFCFYANKSLITYRVKDYRASQGIFRHPNQGPAGA